MIGFFEFQYLSFKKKSLGNLIALAKADGHLDPEEEKLLYILGGRYGLKDRQISVMINNSVGYELFVPESHKEKMDMFYDLMQLVHVDGIVDPNEIDFCHEVAEKFGFKPDIVPWLIRKFTPTNAPQTDEWHLLIDEAHDSYLLEN